VTCTRTHAQGKATEPIHEVRLVRVKRAPASYHLPRQRRWRWDLKTYTPNPIDTRPLMVTGGGHKVGYTFTRWGALRCIARAITGGEQP
jgi:hypothetical protein